MRIKGLIFLKLLAYFNFVFNIILIFVIYKICGGDFRIVYLSILGLAIIIFINHRIISNKYNKLINKSVVKNIIESYQCDFYPDNGIDKEIIKNTGMMSLGNVYKSNNLLVGSYNGVKFAQSDLVIRNVNYFLMVIQAIFTKSAGLYLNDLFIGRWFIFDFNKKITGNIQVRDKEFLNAVLISLDPKEPYSRIETESSHFNSKFLIHAQNSNEAFYVLTPRIMENMLKLSGSIEGKLMFCFIDNKIHIAISKSKNTFKHSVFKKLNYDTISHNTYNDIATILNFIDKLKLDNDIFK